MCNRKTNKRESLNDFFMTPFSFFHRNLVWRAAGFSERINLCDCYNIDLKKLHSKSKTQLNYLKWITESVQ